MSDFALSINNVSRDLEVQKYPPILTPEEEYDLAIELYENGSLSAAKKTSNVAYAFCGLYRSWLQRLWIRAS